MILLRHTLNIVCLLPLHTVSTPGCFSSPATQPSVMITAALRYLPLTRTTCVYASLISDTAIGTFKRYPNDIPFCSYHGPTSGNEKQDQKTGIHFVLQYPTLDSFEVH